MRDEKLRPVVTTTTTTAGLLEDIRQKYANLGYRGELLEQLVDKLNMTTASDILEAHMFTCFKSSPLNLNGKTEWREGHQKSAFNYILIDPRVTRNLPSRAKLSSSTDVFRTFVEAIFYVGKGSRARPYAHLYDSLKDWKRISDTADVYEIKQTCVIIRTFLH